MRSIRPVLSGTKVVNSLQLVLFFFFCSGVALRITDWHDLGLLSAPTGTSIKRTKYGWKK